MAQEIYVGVNSEVPVYETELVEAEWNVDNIDKFFYRTNTDNFTLATSDTYVKITSKSGTQASNLTALYDLTGVTIKCSYIDSSLPCSVSLNGTLISPTTSSFTAQTVEVGNLYKGDVLSINLAAGNYIIWSSYISIKVDSTTVEDKVITGYEYREVARNVFNLYYGKNNKARQIIAGYVGDSNNISRQFYKTISFIEYTGAYTSSITTINNIKYRLYTLTTSGTLTLNKDGQYWVCGAGGGGGGTASPGDYVHSGGGGGGGRFSTGNISTGSYTVTIGAASASNGGKTTVGDSITASGGSSPYNGEGGSGGSGGGAGAYCDNTTESHVFTDPGSGQGTSTIPFGITSLKAHCAGGGGGSLIYLYEDNYQGGTGGSNGSDGGYSGGPSNHSSRAAGGTYGGGAGGGYILTNPFNEDGENATFYGGGGGGAGDAYWEPSYTTVTGSEEPGIGYQGVAYILVPIK